MNTRKINKILRSFHNGAFFEKSFRNEYSFKHINKFSEDSVVVLAYYDGAIRNCVIENDFPYFYITNDKRTFFSCSFNNYSELPFTNDYSTKEEKLKFISRFVTDVKSMQYIIDIVSHFEIQGDLAKLVYSYDIEKNSHSIDYSMYINNSLFIMSFNFSNLKDTVVCISVNYKSTTVNDLLEVKDFKQNMLSVLQKSKYFSYFKDINDVDINLKEAVLLSEIIEY